MKFVSQLQRRLPWLNVAAGVLLVLLQRTPAVRVFVQAKDYVLASRAGELLRAAFTAATLGAMHARAGATTFQPSQPNPVRGTVGTRLDFAFTYTGTPSSPASFQVSGTLPPGLSFSPPLRGNTLPTGTPAITGIPTQAGTYEISVQGFNAEGLTNNVQQPIVFEITGGAAVAPTITTQPQSQTVNAGANVTFSVQATGTPAPSYQWRRNGADIAGATGASLALTNVQPAQAGTYTVVVSVEGGGSVTSSAATLTVNAPGGGGGAPTITSQPLGFTAATGSTAAFTVVATGTGNSYQWRRGGSDIPGATSATLLLRNVSAADAGNYSVRITNGGDSVTSSNATLQVQAGTGRLANLSVRANLAAGQELIVGFTMSSRKNVLLRAIGPALVPFGVGEAHRDPRVEMFNGATKVTENDDWSGSLAPAFAAVGAFSLANGSKDAALQAEIDGPRTASITGPGSGVVLTEVYDSGAGSDVRLVNVSARNFVGTGDNILIAGFVVNGSVARTLLIRAIGPRLADFGVGSPLSDPKLEIYDGQQKIVENDNWSAAIQTYFGTVGAFGLNANSRDAALIVTLPPGSGYTAQVSGVGGGTGEALVEVYEVP